MEQDGVMAGTNMSNGENEMSPGQVDASSPVFKECMCVLFSSSQWSVKQLVHNKPFSKSFLKLD